MARPKPQLKRVSSMSVLSESNEQNSGLKSVGDMFLRVVERFIPATTMVHAKFAFLGLILNIFFRFLSDNGHGWDSSASKK